MEVKNTGKKHAEKREAPLVKDSFLKMVYQYNAIIPFIMALVTLVLAILAFMQWREMNASVDAMHKSIELTQASERPYVGIEKFTLEKLSVGQKITVRIEQKNYGKSPAMNNSIWIHFSFAPADLTDGFNIEDAKEKVPNVTSLAVIWPGFELSARKDSKDIIPNELYKKILENKVRLFVSGYIDYESIHEKKYRTTYCVIYMPESSSFQACKRYNTVTELK